MKQLFSLLILFLLGFIPATSSADEAAVRKTINVIMPSNPPDSVKPSEIPGLYEVMSGPNIVYVSEDGKYLVSGKIIDIEARKDITDAKLAKARVVALDKVGLDKMIIFKPKESKYTVSIFTDIDCGYCRKLHAEMDQYLEQGITVQYLFFPRAGKGSDSYNKAVSVWCADDRNAALTAAKQGKTPETKTCDNPIDKHMALGTLLQTRGTPMLVSQKGTIFPGYMPATQLVKALSME